MCTPTIATAYTDMLGQLHDSAEGKLAFSLGCDFHFSYDNIHDALDHPRRYTIGDTQYLLIEFSDYGIPPSVKHDIFRCSAAAWCRSSPIRSAISRC